ncbi:MAG: NUDIX domain-containing protein, partial [Nannocystaceae bacterium]|nr:NUDIX domain-containing protein [Nannocystaceae bacterium]
YPLGYSFFGGACETGETPAVALARELGEELPLVSARALLEADPNLVGTWSVGPTRYEFHLFEAEVTDETLDDLARAPVFEGERAVVVTRDQLAALPFIWGLGTVVASYLGSTALRLP